MVKIIINENEANQRADRFLRKYLQKATLAMIYKIIRKDLKVNGKRVNESTMLKVGDELVLYMNEEKFQELKTVRQKKIYKKQFKVAYEDENILIVDKPWGLLTHGDSFEKKDTLLNQVCGYLQDKGEYIPEREKTFTPAPVNRLDRNTTGLVIFGKNAEALRELTKFLRQRDQIRKFYLTIVLGTFSKPMMIEEKLSKDRESNITKVISSEQMGQESRTYVKPVIVGKRYSIVEVELLTGRSHQIRVHLADKGFPLIGDIKYGDRRCNLEVKRKYDVTTQLLHAHSLEFGNIEGKLSYMNGKVIKAPLSKQLAKTAEEMEFKIKDIER